MSCKWILSKKLKADETLLKHKARLVARSYSQKQETFRPVIKMTSLCVLVALVAVYHLHIHQLDIQTAFLNGQLREKIYKSQPEGYNKSPDSKKVCQIASHLWVETILRMWYERLHKFLISLGYVDIRLMQMSLFCVRMTCW